MAQEEKKRRGYAVGVQEFDWICERGAVYADKTEMGVGADMQAVGLNISQDRRTIDSYKIVNVK